MWFRGDLVGTPGRASPPSNSGLVMPSKELEDQPNAIGVHDIGFAVCGHLANAALLHVPVYLPTIHTVRLTCEAESAAEFMQADLSDRAVGGQRIAEVEAIIE